jgi:RNA recognition motif-containing protein
VAWGKQRRIIRSGTATTSWKRTLSNGGKRVRRVSKTLYVGNLPWSTTEEDLAQFFSTAAEVRGSRIITDRESGRSRGFGFVEVDDEVADKVIESMNGKNLGGREIIVNEAKPRQPMA